MRLKDMLSGYDFKKLRSIKKNLEIRESEQINKENDKKTKEKKVKRKKKLTFKENEEKRLMERRVGRTIRVCPLCGGDNLSKTSNGYYYCDDCGIKVEKKR